MKNHELVPTPLICTIAALSAGPGGQHDATRTAHCMRRERRAAAARALSRGSIDPSALHKCSCTELPLRTLCSRNTLVALICRALSLSLFSSRLASRSVLCAVLARLLSRLQDHRHAASKQTHISRVQIMSGIAKSDCRAITVRESSAVLVRLCVSSLCCRLLLPCCCCCASPSDDGYRLTYLGYDYLALRTYVARGLISGLGRRIGVGKEADIYECCNESGEKMVLKIHRSVHTRAHMHTRDNRASSDRTPILSPSLSLSHARRTLPHNMR